ncbi:MAG TPA: CHASE3 domain-containing protein [Thiobacillus sp.]
MPNKATWIGSTALLAISAALGIWAANEVSISAGWQKHTLLVLNKKESLLADLASAETGERGYLLTGNERFLGPYFSAVNTLDGKLSELRELTADQPSQQARINALQPLIEDRLDRLKTGIELRKTGDETNAQAFVSSGQGKALMDEIRRIMADFEKLENSLLVQRSERLATDIRNLTLGVFFSALLAVFIAAGAFYRLLKMGEVTRHRAAFQGTLLDSIDAAIISTTPDGIITSFNRSAENLLGYQAKEVVGKQSPIAFHDAEELASHAEGLAHPNGHPVSPGFEFLVEYSGAENRNSREWTYLRKDATRVPVMLTISAMLNDKGNPIGHLIIARDIAAQKASEAQITRTLKELADFKAALDEHAIVATTDASGIITYANEKFCAISKYSRDELLGQDHRIINSGHHPHTFFLDLWQTISNGKVWKGEIQNRAKDGSPYWVNTTIVPFLNDQGMPTQYIAIRADISQRKDAELALVAAKTTAELANHTKDSFLATMSHEIRTPLGGLLGMLELLGFTPLNNDQRDTLRAAHESGRSLLRIVNDILDWSKIEAGKLELAPQATSIRQLLSSVVNTYARVASAKSLILESHIDERLSEAHIVDPLRLSQILNNFVSNALKFTRKGRVLVRAERTGHDDTHDHIKFSVQDTGIGMDLDVQQRLFQNFSQGSTETARMYGGTGLGLAICRRLADLMQGKIGMQSEAGKGSTFFITLTLPLSENNPFALQEHEFLPSTVPEYSLTHSPPPVDAPSILVVDDHPTNRKLLAIQLGLLGLQAETAENGDIALVMWQNGRYAAVITDCHMPKMDGYELAQLIRKTEAEQGRAYTPIIAWTANALPNEAKRCYEAGMDELLVKPAGMPHLKMVLSRWIATPLLLKTQPGNLDSTSTTIAPIDYSELDKLVSSAADKAEVLEEFMTQSWSDITALEAALASRDFSVAARIAHRMRGASRMVGARELTAACLVLQNTAGKGQPDHMHTVRSELDRLAAHLVEAGYHFGKEVK